jgi:hypothetical protein
MKKLTVVVVLLATTLFATLNANEKNNNNLATTIISDCNVRVFDYDVDIRYDNNCDQSVKIYLKYRYKTCSNVSENGRMVKKWSDWKTADGYYWLSAGTGNGIIKMGDHCTEYEHLDWNFAN